MRGKERPMEPLIAAILGLAREVGLGDIANAKFEKASLIVLRGDEQENLLLSLLVGRVTHQEYLAGIYLLEKIEEKLGLEPIPDVVTDELVETTKEIIDKYFDKVTHIPDFLGSCFMETCEKFGPMFYSSILAYFFRKHGEDPLITLLRDPKLFIKEMEHLLGKGVVDQFMLYMLIHFCNEYKEICSRMLPSDLRGLVRKILRNIRRLPKREVSRRFRRMVLLPLIDSFFSTRS